MMSMGAIGRYLWLFLMAFVTHFNNYFFKMKNFSSSLNSWKIDELSKNKTSSI